MVSIAKIPNLNKHHPLHKKADHVQSVLKATSPGGKLAEKNKDPKIDISIYRSKTGNYAPIGEYFCIVKFYSHVKPDFAAAAPVLLQRKSHSEVDFEVGVLCGAMAERLGEVYGDNFDPDFAARHGSAKLADLLAHWEETTKDEPAGAE